MSEKYLTLKLAGGLGNQLFQYFAGRYFSQQYNLSLILDLTNLKNSFTYHTSSLKSFDIKGNFIETENLRTNLENKIINLLSSPHYKFFSKNDELLRQMFKIYISREVGFDKNVPTIKPDSILSGYFQSNHYVDFFKPKITDKEFKIKFPSTKYISLLDEAKSCSPIMVHIRRGDYSKIPDIGVLSYRFYLNGINLLLSRTELASREVWIFSDEIYDVHESFPSNLEWKPRFIFESAEMDPAESLVLMANGCANVISNSTFSWWSAYLSQKKSIVAPTKWFKNLNDPKYLIPSSWIKINSQWV